MSAPQYVPTPTGREKYYESPPRTRGSWNSDRPGELVGEGQPEGEAFGAQGPDQGYALRLVGHLDLHLSRGEHLCDAESVIVLTALRRASHFGRAPVIHDLRIAATLFGFLDERPDPELVAWRRSAFAEVGHPHHYFERLELANGPAIETLIGPPDAAGEAYRSGWRAALGLSAA